MYLRMYMGIGSITIDGTMDELLEFVIKYSARIDSKESASGDSGSDKSHTLLPSKVISFEEPAPKPTEEPQPTPKFSEPKTTYLTYKEIKIKKNNNRGNYTNELMKQYMEECPHPYGSKEFKAYYARGMYHATKGQTPIPEGNRKSKKKIPPEIKTKTDADKVANVELRGYSTKVPEQEGAYIPREKPKDDICDFCYATIPRDPIKNKEGNIFCSEMCKKNYEKGETFGETQRNYENNL